MKSFASVTSPMSWLTLCLYIYPAIFVVFGITLKEALLFFLVDLICFVPVNQIESSLFKRWYPGDALFFPKLKEDKITELKLKDRVTLLESLFTFPARRSKHLLLASCPKVLIPGTVLIWIAYHSCSNFEQFIRYMAFESVILAYFYAAYYIEMHDFVSKKIAEFHKNFDFTEAFEHVCLPVARNGFFVQENLGLVAVMFMSFLLIAIQSASHNTYEIFGLAVVCLALVVRIYYLNRKFFIGGLIRLFDKFESIETGVGASALPLHSARVLAKFEKTFNTLNSRLQAREQELTQWVRHEADESRFRTIGEMSGLIAHDLATPLHIIQFCVGEIQEGTTPEKHDRYFGKVIAHTQRAIELVESLRAYLKNPTGTNASIAHFEEAHNYVIRLLTMQYDQKGFRTKISFVVDDKVRCLSLRMPRIDLIHVLDNLYRNSVENLLANAVPAACVNVKADETANASLVRLFFTDNGTGLSSSKFDEMTAPRGLLGSNITIREGLGLRLTRRLIERHSGSLEVVDPVEPSSGGNPGATFVLTLHKNEDRPAPHAASAFGQVTIGANV